MTETLLPTEKSELRSAFVAPLDRIEIREAGDGGGEFTLTGHAAVFDRWSEELWTFAGTFRERIASGAFEQVLKGKPDVRLLFNHDGLALARTKSGTLELSEDDEGLRVWARLAPTGVASDLRMAMQRGDVDQMSFAFTIAEDEWHEDHDSEEIERTILRVDELFDVSVVTFPAYPDTSVAMRELRAAAQAGKLHLRTVIPFRATPKAEEGSPWDGPGEVARADVDDLRAMCCWYDSNAPENKGSYKLPHHRASDSHLVVWRGVRAAMGRLMQADIPQDDKRGCHSHLAKHYDQFDKEAPNFDDLARALSLDLSDEAYETREALGQAVAQAETDSAGQEAVPIGAEAETDPPVDDERDVSASAEIDPAVGGKDALDLLRLHSKERVQAEKESYLRLLKEITR
jgi:HK97 family phage prohead protease